MASALPSLPSSSRASDPPPYPLTIAIDQARGVSEAAKEEAAALEEIVISLEGGEDCSKRLRADELAKPRHFEDQTFDLLCHRHQQLIMLLEI